MAYKIGKITKFDNYIGEIVDNTNKYLFLDTDLQEEVLVGDVVSFQSETIEDINRAFLVSKFDPKLSKNQDNTHSLRLDKDQK